MGRSIVVKESVTSAWVEVKIATGAEIFEFFGEVLEGFYGDELVLISEKDYCGWGIFLEVMCWGKLAEAGLETIVSPLPWAIVADGVIEDEGVGFTGNGKIILWIVLAFDECGKGG